MSIASEITRINTNIAAAYTAANGKGATMPVSQNSANLADTIDSIPSGGIPIDEDSLKPIVFGIDNNGFYYSDNAADETPVFFGRDAGGLYVTDGGNV